MQKTPAILGMAALTLVTAGVFGSSSAATGHPAQLAELGVSTVVLVAPISTATASHDQSTTTLQPSDDGGDNSVTTPLCIGQGGMVGSPPGRPSEFNAICTGGRYNGYVVNDIPYR